MLDSHVLIFILGGAIGIFYGWCLGYTQGQNREIKDMKEALVSKPTKSDFGEFIDRMMHEMRCQDADSLHFHCSVHRDNFDDDDDDWDGDDEPIADGSGVDPEFRDPDYWKKR